MDQIELASLMKDTAQDAVENAKEQLGIELDYSNESVMHIDRLISHYLDNYQSQTLDQKTIFTVCHMFGSYVGEVFKRSAGGHWVYDDSDPDAPNVLLHYQDKSFAFAGICYERLIKDSSVSVKKYFDLALNFATH